MSIRIKTIIIVSVIAVICCLTIFFLSQNMFMPSFKKLEKREAENDTARAVNALSSQLDSLDTQNHDWAAQDMTYLYVLNPNNPTLSSIEAATSDKVMMNAELNFVTIIDASGNIVFSKAFDLYNNKETPLWPSMREHLFNDFFIHHTDLEASMVGIITLTEGPLMVSSRPIVTSQGKGPIAGTMIMGRFLDSAVVNKLAETVHMPFSLTRFDSEEMTHDLQIARTSLSEEKPTFIKALTGKSVGGYALIDDIYGKPALILKVELPRDIYAEGNNTWHYFTIVVLVLGLLIGILTILLLSKLVVSRLSKLSKDVAAIGASGDLTQRLKVIGNDEVSAVAKTINRTLSSLEQSQKELTQYQGRLEDLVSERTLELAKANLELQRDILKQKRAEESLRQSEEKYKTIFESAREGIIISVPGGRILSANAAAAAILGYNSPEELVGILGHDLYADLKQRKTIRAELMKKDYIEEMEITLKKKDGTPVHVLGSTTLHRDEQGRPLRLESIWMDITERKHMQEQLAVTGRLASVGEMASGIAHELNNPLTSVIGLSQLLMESEPPADVKEDVEAIYKEAQRAAAVTKNLLAFARKHEPMRQHSQVNKIIEDVLKLRAYEHKVNSIEVTTHLDAQLPEVLADQFQMQQVFLNIILNAESAMTEAHQKGTLTVTTEKVDSHIKISFADDGPGIAKDIMGKIFDPFFTTKEVGKGTGLGLSICYGIVANHGGKIYANSKLGSGATFVVELPINT